MWKWWFSRGRLHRIQETHELTLANLNAAYMCKSKLEGNGFFNTLPFFLTLGGDLIKLLNWVSDIIIFTLININKNNCLKNPKKIISDLKSGGVSDNRLIIKSSAFPLNPKIKCPLFTSFGFNIFNDCKENGKKLFITGANSPNNMGLRSDLASRLSWGLVYQIKPLTDSEKKLALLSHSKQKGMSCSENVIEYCMKHLQRDLHFLIATLDALDNWSLKMKKPITIPLLKKLLKNKVWLYCNAGKREISEEKTAWKFQ